jgi:hypothetical protein
VGTPPKKLFLSLLPSLLRLFFFPIIQHLFIARNSWIRSCSSVLRGFWAYRDMREGEGDNAVGKGLVVPRGTREYRHPQQGRGEGT